MAKIEVKGTEISIMTINNDDYISLTDMLKAKDGDFFVSDWLSDNVQDIVHKNNGHDIVQ